MAAKKVAILGVGQIGGALAHHLVLRNLCEELVLVDADPRLARAQAADLRHSLGVLGGRTRIRSGTYYDCDDAQVCVLTVSANPAPNAPRLEQLDRSATTVGRIVPTVMATGFSGVLVVLTDPSDLMAWLAHQLSDLPPERVIGLGTSLDVARLRSHLAEVLDTDPAAVEAWVLGDAGEEPVIPWSQVRVNGNPLPETLDREAVANTAADTAYNLIQGKGSAAFAMAAAAADIVDAVLCDRHKTLCVSAALHGEYGQDDIFLSVPAVIGSSGVERIVELELTPEETRHMDKAARELCQYMIDIT